MRVTVIPATGFQVDSEGTVAERAGWDTTVEMDLPRRLSDQVGHALELLAKIRKGVESWPR
jgi:hypothetical protein